MELRILRDALLRIASPYTHLYHADGSKYMERFIVVKRKDENSGHVRLHHICTEDRDKHLHDHPFSFWSLVLTGGYIEARPVIRGPCFVPFRVTGEWIEEVRMTQRYAGSLSYRHACDRHKIMHVKPNTWTLVFAGPLRQWWGFYTPRGKIYWQDYDSVHGYESRIEK